MFYGGLPYCVVVQPPQIVMSVATQLYKWEQNISVVTHPATLSNRNSETDNADLFQYPSGHFESRHLYGHTIWPPTYHTKQIVASRTNKKLIVFHSVDIIVPADDLGNEDGVLLAAQWPLQCYTWFNINVSNSNVTEKFSLFIIIHPCETVNGMFFIWILCY